MKMFGVIGLGGRTWPDHHLVTMYTVSQRQRGLVVNPPKHLLEFIEQLLTVEL